MNKTLKSILVILSYFAYYFVIILPFVIFDIDIKNISSNLFHLYQISTEIIFIAILILIYKDDFKKYINNFKKHNKDYLKIAVDYWLVGVAIMIASNFIISRYSPISLPENEQAVREALKGNPILVVISIIATAPLLEEILFRKTLFDLNKNKDVFIVMSGLLFGAFHIIFIGESIYSWLYIIPYTALGIAFAAAYVKTKIS